MDGDTFHSIILSLGLDIDDRGRITEQSGDDTYLYMTLTGNGQIDIGRERTVNLSSIEYIETSSRPHTIVVSTISDEEYKVRGKRLMKGTDITISMPKMDSELADIFDMIYPEYREKLFYDILLEREIVDLSLFDPSSPKGTFVPLDESVEIIYYDDVERKLKAQGCRGSPPSTAIRLRVLLGKIYKSKRNLFKEWVLSHPWDGKKRVDTWFVNVFGATAPQLRKSGLEMIYLAKVSRAWFTGAILRMDQEISHEVVPVLIGPQGKCRKTSGLRYTAGRQQWFKDVLSDVTTPMGVSKFLDTVRGKVVVELAESTAIRTKDQDALKGFISMSADQYRKPYARREQSWPRHFVLAATSNIDDVFVDLTGNRRYYPMFCTPSDFTYRTKYNVEQVWAEAYVLAQRGEPSYIDSEWVPAKLMQGCVTQENTNVQSIDSWLNDPANGFTMMGVRTCREEIMERVFGIKAGQLPSKEIETAFRAWRRGTRFWDHDKEFYYYRGKRTKAITRIYTPEGLAQSDPASISAETAQALREAFDRETAAVDGRATLADTATQTFQAICAENSLMYENCVFPCEGVPEDVLGWLVENGTLVKDGELYRVMSFDL